MIKSILKSAGIVFLITLAQQAMAQEKLTRQQADELATKALGTALAARKEAIGPTWRQNSIMKDSLKMKFDFRIFGKKPVDGHSLYISLHGGGNATAAVNDQQWQNQRHLYTPEEGMYLVPRAPTNTWNLWHEDHIDGMLEDIIKNTVVMDGVNPNKVYIMGYSAGGDGVFQLAPRMADYWAAAAMMAGHPGDASALNLRNLPFAIYMGGVDSAYQRNQHAQEWQQMLDSLQQTDTAGFIHDVHIYPGLPHWMNRNDTIALDWMKKYTRNALPNKVDWVQDDRHRHQFYWLGTNFATAKTGDKAIVSIKANTITIEQNTLETLFVYLNDKLLDLDKPVTVMQNGKKIFKDRLERSAPMIQQTAADRLQTDFIFCVRIEIKQGKVVR